MLFAVLFVLPFVVSVVCCFSTDSAIKGNDILSSLSFDNFMQNSYLIFNNQLFIKSILNSLIVSSLAAVLSCFIASFVNADFVLTQNADEN